MPMQTIGRPSAGSLTRRVTVRALRQHQRNGFHELALFYVCRFVMSEFRKKCDFRTQMTFYNSCISKNIKYHELKFGENVDFDTVFHNM